MMMIRRITLSFLNFPQTLASYPSQELAYTLHINSLTKGGSSLTKSFFLFLEVHQFGK